MSYGLLPEMPIQLHSKSLCGASLTKLIQIQAPYNMASTLGYARDYRHFKPTKGTEDYHQLIRRCAKRWLSRESTLANLNRYALKQVAFSLPRNTSSKTERAKFIWRIKRTRDEKNTGYVLRSTSPNSKESLRESREKQVLSALRKSKKWQSASGRARREMKHVVVMRLATRRYLQLKLKFEVTRRRNIDPICDFEAKKRALDGMGGSKSRVVKWQASVAGQKFCWG